MLESRSEDGNKVARATADLPGTVITASLAELDSASQLLATPLLDEDIVPTLVQDLLDPVGDVDDRGRRDEIVVLLDVTVVELLVPEAVGRLAVLVHVGDLNAMPDLAFATQRGERADIRVHGRKDQTSVGDLAADVLGAVVPIDAQRVDGPLGVVLRVEEFHDAAQIVRLAWRLTDQVDMICD